MPHCLKSAQNKTRKVAGIVFYRAICCLLLKVIIVKTKFIIGRDFDIVSV